MQAKKSLTPSKGNGKRQPAPPVTAKAPKMDKWQKKAKAKDDALTAIMMTLDPLEEKLARLIEDKPAWALAHGATDTRADTWILAALRLLHRADGFLAHASSNLVAESMNLPHKMEDTLHNTELLAQALM